MPPTGVQCRYWNSVHGGQYIDPDDVTYYSDRLEAHFTLFTDDRITVTYSWSADAVGTHDVSFGYSVTSGNAANFNVWSDTCTYTITAAPAITITAASASKPFDGTALTNGDCSVSGLPDGYTCEATVSGSQLLLGSSDNVISSYRIYRGEEDVTSVFTDVETEKGTLTVTTNDTPIVFTYGSFTFEYAEFITYGESHYPDAWGTISGVPSALDTGMGASVNSKVVNVWFVEDVGTYTIEPDFGIYYYYDYYDGGVPVSEDVTSWFTNIEVKTGTITIIPAPLTVTTGSGSKVYDGTALTNSEATISGLVGDDAGKVTVTATGTITDAGSATNTCTIDWGAVKAGNYTVTENLGTLTVEPAPITIQTGSETKAFDGYPLPETTDMPHVIGTFYEPIDFYAATDVITDAGTAENPYVIVWGDAKEGNYHITEELGTLTVTPLEVEIDLGGYNYESGDGSFTYDGTFHGPEISASCDDEGFFADQVSDTDWDISWEARGDVIRVHAAGGGTDAGEYTFDCSAYVLSGKSGNYAVSITGRTMTISPAPLTVTTGSGEKEYDGTPLTNSEASLSGLVGAETAYVNATGTITEIGVAENTYEILWGSANLGNYTITENLGTLRVRGTAGGHITYTWDGTSGTVSYGGYTYTLLDRDTFMNYYSANQGFLTDAQIIENLLAMGVIIKA